MNNKLASFCGTIDMFHEKWMYVININALNNPNLNYLLNVESLIFRYIEFSFDDGDVEKFTDYNVRRWNIAHEKILGGFTSKIFRVEETAISCFLDEDDEFIEANTLNVKMTRLRKKLGEIGFDKHIMTKRGSGYALV